MGRNEKIKDMTENRENFLTLSKEVYPLMKKIRELLKENGFNAAHITIGTEGYMEFSPYETGWSLRRYSTDGVTKAVYELKDEIPLEEV